MREPVLYDFTQVDEDIARGAWDRVMAWAEEHHETTDAAVAEKVMACYRLCMAQGIPEASLNLGTFYYNGIFVRQDFQKAYELYKTAADAGVCRAICNCGYCFYYGRHQEADPAQALYWFSLGVMLFNDANCLYKLGDLYLAGKGVEANERYAFILYERALAECLECGDNCLPDAQWRVGKCYLRGIGTAPNVEYAHALLSAALVNLYKRRETDPFVGGVIRQTRALVNEAEAILNGELV